MPDSETVQFDADRGDSRLRLDQILVRRVTGISRLSRSVAQRWIASGAVAVNGRPAHRASARVREGAAITVVIPSSARRRSAPHGEAGELDVIYEDSTLIVVNKPPGVVVHPSYKNASGTLLNVVLWRVRHVPDARPGILTRLDRDTSGLVVVALTARAHATLQRDAAAQRVRKEYLAVVRGSPRPARGRILLPLARDPVDRRRVVVTSGGAASETRYEVIARASPRGARLSLVRCELVTGRTHQIRVHLAARGWPVLGDRLYGEADADIPRQALHAWRISLPHPSTGARLDLEARLPSDIEALGMRPPSGVPGATLRT
jgi:23S rRNA pseudouridine1911/1915/1917 synthase